MLKGDVMLRAAPVLLMRAAMAFVDTVNQANLRELAASHANHGLVVTVRACVCARVCLCVCPCMTCKCVRTRRRPAAGSVVALSLVGLCLDLLRVPMMG